ncbi:MAG: transglutaminase family protein [Deltaproteobacteria bacterium]|nr:transglutaminase family protein [Deltaproteobacteria bacterium]
MTSRAPSLLGFLGLLALAVGARADGGILHEYFSPDEVDPLLLTATRPSSGGPSASERIDTPSGPIERPDPTRTPPPAERYSPEPAANAASFAPDRDTRRPDNERYDDPFTPELTPYKRLHVLDAVRDDYSLYVREPRHEVVPVGSGLAEGEERFFADLRVTLPAHEPVRIPTPAPGTRALGLTSSPVEALTLLRDGADNWFVRAPRDVEVRLVLDLAAPREAFAADFADVPWRALPVVPPQPPSHRASYERVAAAVGLSAGQSPREVVTRMTEYFRSFVPSEEPPPTSADIYLDLALSRKGVCRHRAFAFLVTALHAGIPTRLVHNEAHAWVEVKDDRSWHRLDLGGAALDLRGAPRLDRPRHVPPPDRFAWPTGRDGGDDLGARERRDAERAAERARPSDGGSTGAATTSSDPAGRDGSGPAPQEDGATPLAPTPGDARTPATVSLDDLDRELFRGKPLHLRGTVRVETDACPNVRVDVVLQARGQAERRVGSLATDERGAFDGAVTLPFDLTVGDYELFVATPGGGRCGAGRSR